MATEVPGNKACFTLGEIATLTGGELLPGSASDDVVTGVVLDSRRLVAGNLFVALRGEQHDAHAFLAAATAVGASALVERGHASLARHPGVRGVSVSDPLFALGELARAHRARWSGRLVGITGSVGKTSTKRLVSIGLAGVGARVWATPGNLNNRVGVPMTLFVLDDQVDTAVIEMGTSEPGEIARLAEITRPDVAVVTHVALAHTAGLGTIEEVAREKGALFMALGPSDVAIGCGDDVHVHQALAACAAGRKVRYGLGDGNLWRGRELGMGREGMRVAFSRVADEHGPAAQYELTVRVIGDAGVENLAAVAAVLDVLGYDPALAAKALAGAAPEPGRLVPMLLSGDRLIIDDTYNASPASVAMAIDTAARIARDSGRALVAVLGDMRELGRHSVAEHRAVGAHLARAGVRQLITAGPEMRAAARAARERGVAVHETGSSEAAALAALARVRDGDVVLVKGSRSTKMERVVAALAGPASPPSEVSR